MIRYAISLLMICEIFLGALPTRAFEPPVNYLFIETLVVQDVVLPPGVIIRVSDTATQPQAVLVIENQTETLLFVLSLSYKDVLVMETPDPDWKNRINLAHEVASYLATPTRSVYLNMAALIDLDQNLVDHNELIFSPPAADTAIPAPQKSELLLVYGEQVLLVPFTISYSLNTHFDDGSQAYEQWMAYTQATDDARTSATQQALKSASQARTSNMTVIGLLGFTALVIVTWLVWRGLARRK